MKHCALYKEKEKYKETKYRRRCCNIVLHVLYHHHCLVMFQQSRYIFKKLKNSRTRWLFLTCQIFCTWYHRRHCNKNNLTCLIYKSQKSRKDESSTFLFYCARSQNLTSYCAIHSFTIWFENYQTSLKINIPHYVICRFFVSMWFESCTRLTIKWKKNKNFTFLF